MEYLDASAFVKLIVAERESLALRQSLGPAAVLVSSALVVVESRRTAMRYGDTAVARAQSALIDVTLIPIDDITLEHAASLSPGPVRSLDAIHLATAVSLGADLHNFYCYDTRLAEAAEALGLRVAAPA